MCRQKFSAHTPVLWWHSVRSDNMSPVQLRSLTAAASAAKLSGAACPTATVLAEAPRMWMGLWYGQRTSRRVSAA